MSNKLTVVSKEENKSAQQEMNKLCQQACRRK